MWPRADLILNNGKVFIGTAEGAAEALAIWNGQVLATGTGSEIAALRGPATRMIDLEGRLATPGLYEAHMHRLPLGLMMADVDVRPRFAVWSRDLLSAAPEQILHDTACDLTLLGGLGVHDRLGMM